MSIKFLKVKIKSLAEEARIIRLEEKRTRGSLREQLHRHRVWDVRREARSAQLAYGYLRGRTYRQLESSARTEPDFARIGKLVSKYGGRAIEKANNELMEWYSGSREDSKRCA
jgi:hypothetical protein